MSIFRTQIFYFFYPRAFWICRDNNATNTFKAHKGSKDIVKIDHVTSLVQPYTLRNKCTKAVTGAVPFQEVQVCTYLKCTYLNLIGTKVYLLKRVPPQWQPLYIYFWECCFLKLQEYFFVCKKTPQIKTLFNNSFSSMSVFVIRSREHHSMYVTQEPPFWRSTWMHCSLFTRRRCTLYIKQFS